MTVSETTPAAEVSAEPLWRLGTAFFARKVILIAAEMGLFTALADGPLTETELRERLDLHPRASRDFFDTLVALGMLDRDGSGYGNTPTAGHFLDQRQPSYVGAFLTMADARWDRLPEALRSGEPLNRWGAGAGMFTEQYRTTPAWRNFTAGMDYLNGLIGPALARTYDWSDVVDVVDVGGARGNLIAAILRDHPAVKAAVYDLPGVEPVFAEHMASLGLDDRVTFHAGNFFEDPMPSAGVLIFSHVLHDWGVEERRQLVGKAFEALPPGGALLVIDPMIDDDRRGTETALLTSLNMLMVTPHGSEYTASECREWLREAGFAEVRSFALGTHNTLLEARKPA
jgi:hypothetical protein